MSNFGSLGLVTEGLPGTAPQIFVGSTVDNLGTITAAGYLNDLSKKIKQNDVFYINYSDTSTFPLYTGEASTLGEFYVNYSAPNWSLVNALTGLGQAAAKDVTDNTKALVASVTGSFVVNDFVLAADTAGTIKASGYNVNNILQYASVAITAAEFNGMYAAPKLLIAAPGANTLILVERMELVMTFVAAAYAAGGIVAAQYDNTVHGGGVLATNSEAAADFQAAASSTFAFSDISSNTVGVLPFSQTVNKELYLSNATGAFTTGDGTWVAKIHYRTIAVA